jgi:hypothetical protein
MNTLNRYDDPVVCRSQLSRSGAALLPHERRGLMCSRGS